MAPLPPFKAQHLMLAYKSEPFSKEGWLFSLKYDGYRCLAIKDGKLVRLQTRHDVDATSWYPQIVQSLGRISGNFVMDCEVCAIDEKGHPDFEAMSPRPNGIRKGRMAALFCFDLLYRRTDLRDKPLTDRLARLQDMFATPRDNLLRVQHIETHGKELFERVDDLGIEGVMAKRADSKYIAGRSRCWLKFKLSDYQEGWKRKKRLAV
jgi:bifunctional non-homologous end joining protein LigD